MENLTIEQLKGLGEQKQQPSVSIFMPTYRAGPDVQQNSIRFRNLLRETEKRLHNDGMRPPDIEAMLEPAQALHDDMKFWEHQYDGLAVFVAPDDFHMFRLPFTLEERVIIGESYNVKPLLPLFTNNGHYYLLAISQNEVKLYEGTRYSIGQIDLPEDTPTSLEEALRYDQPERQLQFHTGTAPGGMRDGMFHGHGVTGDEEQKEQVERYLNLVDDGLKPLYRDIQTPLVLAGVEYLLPIYRNVSEYRHIPEAGIEGNPEHMPLEKLREEAWKIVEPQFREQWEAAVGQYYELANAEKASDSLKEIVKAAFYGRVATLMLADRFEAWGSFDPETGKVNPHGETATQDGDIDLVDFAAVQTLRHGGTVYTLPAEEMPEDKTALAVLRY